MKSHSDIFRHLILLTIVIFGGLTSCRQIESITTERTVRVDSVQVPVVTSAHDTASSFVIGDSLIFEDDRLRIRIVPVFGTQLSPDVRQLDNPVSIDDSDTVGNNDMVQASAWTIPTGYQVEATVKPDTVFVKVPQTTITEKTEEVRLKKEMPNWGWALIGGLVMLVLIGIVGARLMR